jgi:hypothetical protein
MAGDENYNYLYRLMRGQAHPDGRAKDIKLGVLDLGHDVRIMFTTRAGSEVRTGLVESHPGPNGEECCGSVTFDVPEAEGISGPRWRLVSLEPLHIEPSILCRTCGHHGFIRNGRWENA